MLNESMNLVVPVKESGDAQIYAYHTPISREVFEANFRALAATKAALASKGLYYQMDAGPRIAALTLRDEAMRDADMAGRIDKDGKPSTQAVDALLAEFRRLTTVLCPTPKGWQQLPVDVALSTGEIDEEDWAEAESAICFFTCHYAMAKKKDRNRIGLATAGVLNALTTSSTPTEYVASLSKSTATVVSQAPAAESSVPS